MKRAIFVLLLSSLACGDDDSSEVVETVTVPTAPEEPTRPEAPTIPELVSRERELMGTVFVVQAQTTPELDAGAVRRSRARDRRRLRRDGAPRRGALGVA